MRPSKRSRYQMVTTAPTSQPKPSTVTSRSQEPDRMTDTAPTQLAGWRHVYSGKVRNLYEPVSAAPGTSETLLVVATDRISAFDQDRKSTRLNSSHVAISYAVFCLKKKKKNRNHKYDQQSNDKQRTYEHR